LNNTTSIQLRRLAFGIGSFAGDWNRYAELPEFGELELIALIA
jgi:hypothetical protein